MTELRDLMHQAVDHHFADHVGLVVRAKRGGSTLRRRRLLSGTGSSLAALSLVVAATAGAHLLLHSAPTARAAVALGDHRALTEDIAAVTPRLHTGRHGASGHRREHHVRSAHEHVGPSPSRRAGAALASAVSSVWQGGFSKVAGYRISPGGQGGISAVGHLTLASTSGATKGFVSAAWQPTDPDVTNASWLAQCRNDMQHCRVWTLPDGSQVRSETTHQARSGISWAMNVVERDTDGMTVVVAAFAPHGNRFSLTDPEAPLTVRELAHVADRLTPPA